MFGRPRDIAAGNNLLASWQGVTKGYTDHEHLNEQQLIHMNGRIYDFNVGRFLSVDPFLQFPENSQSANPYSYILNNPMSGTDPTGYAVRVAGCEQTNSCPGPHDLADVASEQSQVANSGSSRNGSSNDIEVKTVTSGQTNDKVVSINKEATQVGLQTASESIGTSGARLGGGSSGESTGALDAPNLMYAELAEGVTWGSLSSEQQEYIVNQDKMISKATADILAIPPNSVLDTEAVKGFRDNYANISHIFHNTRLKNGAGEYVHALVRHNAWGKNGKITRVAFSSSINYSSSSMANFRNAQSVSQADEKLGYHAKLRAGMGGLYDLTVHEMGHTFNQSNPVGLTGAQFQKQEESRADSFLKEIRGF